MFKNHFVSHFLPFQINTTIFICVNFFYFYKMAANHRPFQINTKLFFYFLQNGRRHPFRMSEIHLRSHFLPFQIDTELLFWKFYFCEFIYKMDAGGHFGYPKITFGRISGHFRSIRNFFLFFFTKWLPSAILDVRNSLWITFLAILDQYRFFF